MEPAKLQRPAAATPPAPEPLAAAIAALPHLHGGLDRAELDGAHARDALAPCAAEARALALALLFVAERDGDDADERRGRQAVLVRLGRDLERLSAVLEAAVEALEPPA